MSLGRGRLLLPLCLSAVAVQSCGRAMPPVASPEPITVSGGVISIRPESKFMEQLLVVPLSRAPGGERKLRTVGQMIAVANPSGALLNSSVSWAVLDAELIRRLQLHLSGSAPVGYAYGVASIPANYHDEIHSTERVEVYRYGLRQNSAQGTVLSVQTEDAAQNEMSVIFTIAQGKDWYPGTNCQIEFPLVRRSAVALSPLSMLHEGVREFVLKETATGRYVPVEITVLNETHDQVYALGDLSPGDRVIERGAILLKPVTHQILGAGKDAAHVR